MHDIDDYPDARLVPGLVVYRYDSPLFFANADDFKRERWHHWTTATAPSNGSSSTPRPTSSSTARRWTPSRRCARTRGRGVVFAMARVKQDLRDVLEPSGFLDRVGANRVFMTLPTAVQASRRGIETGTARRCREWTRTPVPPPARPDRSRVRWGSAHEP